MLRLPNSDNSDTVRSNKRLEIHDFDRLTVTAHNSAPVVGKRNDDLLKVTRKYIKVSGITPAVWNGRHRLTHVQFVVAERLNHIEWIVVDICSIGDIQNELIYNLPVYFIHLMV